MIDLRTRIAKVLFARNAGLDSDMKPRSWYFTDDDGRADWLADADAVIRELDESATECWDQWPARRCLILGTVNDEQGIN